MIHGDIRQAETLPSDFYQDLEIFNRSKDKVFVPSWQWIGTDEIWQSGINLYPLYLLEHFLDEPILLSQTDAGVRCISNVCTHRGNIMIHHPGKSRRIVCGYHGRRFGLEGKMEHMPEFEEAQDFPRACDHLPQFDLMDWHGHQFVNLQDGFDLRAMLEIMDRKVGFLPISDFRHNPASSKDFLVHAHWALYCDNYLEGFHIPFVHHDLNAQLDYGSYSTHEYEHMTLQIGYSSDSGDCFELPMDHEDHGKRILAYYFWLWPNMMFNFYPWGLQVNVVKPLGLNRTRVSFITYVYEEERFADGVEAASDKVEREDEFVVENVHRGLKSRYYKTGRFSPKRESGVHHFHRLLAKYLGY